MTLVGSVSVGGGFNSQSSGSLLSVHRTTRRTPAAQNSIDSLAPIVHGQKMPASCAAVSQPPQPPNRAADVNSGQWTYSGEQKP